VLYAAHRQPGSPLSTNSRLPLLYTLTLPSGFPLLNPIGCSGYTPPAAQGQRCLRPPAQAAPAARPHRSLDASAGKLTHTRTSAHASEFILTP